MTEEEITLQQLKEQEANLVKQFAEMQKAMQEIAASKLKLEQEIKAKQPLEITVIGVAEIKRFDRSIAAVHIKNEYRTDIIEVLRSIPDRSYGGGQDNLIPISEWDNAKLKLAALPNVTLVTTPELEAEITLAANAPTWLVTMETGGRAITAKPAVSKANDVMMYGIPGASKYAARRDWRIPLPEAWRLPTAFGEQKVVYSDDVAALIENQLTQRSTIDVVATAEDWPEYDVKFANEDFKLRPFQKVAGQFTEVVGRRALISLEMGLGKTWVAVGHCLKNKRRTLIVCPATLKSNWAREVKRLTGNSAKIYQGIEPSKFDIVELLTNRDRQFSIINFDIIGRKVEYKDVTKDTEGFEHEKHVVRYPWVEMLNLAGFDTIVVDESHYIKSPDAQRSVATRLLKAAEVIHMTGTPVLNRPGELWPTLNHLHPELFPSYDTFMTQYTYRDGTVRNAKELRELLKPIMFRRLKKDVIKDLPPVNRIIEVHDLSKKAEKLYMKVLQGLYLKVKEYDSRGQDSEHNVNNILVQIIRLKQICAIDKCSRTAELAQEAYDSADEGEKKKVIIFTQFKAVAFRISQLLGHEAVCFVNRTPKDFVTVDQLERDRLVQQFKTDPKIKFLVVTEKTMKEGHNVTEAGTTIFNDIFWTPAAHEQAEGRSYGRLSDLHSINSYYLLANSEVAGEGNSIEEWIYYDVLARKFGVIQEAVEGVEADRDSEGSTFKLIMNKLREQMLKSKS